MITISGTEVIHASQNQVWKILTTPEDVAALMPNLREWHYTDQPDQYQTVLAFRWGNKVSLFDTLIVWDNDAATQRARMMLNGRSTRSAFEAQSQMDLRPFTAGYTELTWQAEASVQGALSEFPEQFTQLAALMAIKRFFRQAKQKLQQT